MPSLWIAIIAICCVAAYAYLKMALRLNIVDKPNERSSHKTVTILGIGILICLLLPLSLLFKNNLNPLFYFGLLSLGFVGLIDDRYDLSSRLRLALQFGAVVLCWIGVGLPLELSIAVIAGILLSIGVVNAYNFMDGINGMSILNAIVFAISLIYIDYSQNLMVYPRPLLYVYLIILVILSFFNVRKRALAFLGDAGSLVMGLFSIIGVLSLVWQTGQWGYFGLLLVFGVDSVGTILFRIVRKENIFQAHRLHAYQMLVNEKKFSHLTISLLYAMLQLLINMAIIHSESSSFDSIWTFLFFLVILIATYLSLRMHYFKDFNLKM